MKPRMFIFIIFPICFLAAHQGFSQTLSDQSNQDWTSDVHWSGLAPGYDMERSATLRHNSNVSNEIIVKSNYVLIIEAGVTLTTNQVFTIKEDATVIIRGSLVGTAGTEFKIEGNATLIIENGGSIDWAGYWTTNDASVNITVDGDLNVDGNFFNKGTIDGSGTVSVGGSTNNDGGTVFGCNDSGNACCTGSSPCVLGTVLPIRLIDFSARAINGNVLLSWQTTMEEGFKEFVVQRSFDGLTFENLAQIPGLGFDIHGITSEYFFKDTAPVSGLNYYRLKAVDLDDSYECFGVKAVRATVRRRVAIHPNPSSGEGISFDLNFRPDESATIVVLDQRGLEVFRTGMRSMETNVSFTDKLHPGVYMLRYIAGDFESTTRFIVRN